MEHSVKEIIEDYVKMESKNHLTTEGKTNFALFLIVQELRWIRKTLDSMYEGG